MSTAIEDVEAPEIAPGDADAPDGQAAFKERFLQISLEISHPTFSTKLTQHRIERYNLAIATRVADRQLSDDAEEQLGKQIDLLTPAQRKIVATAASKVKAFVTNESMTLASSIDGLRVLPLAKKNAFFDAWPAVKARFAEDLAPFFAIYEAEVVERNRAVLSRNFGDALCAEIVRRHLPPLGQMRSRFSVKVVPGLFNYEDAADAREAVEYLARSVRTQLVEAIEKLRDKLASAKKMTPDSFNEIRRAVEMLRSFADLGDTQLLDAADKLTAATTRAISACNTGVKGQNTMTQILKQMGSGSLGDAIAGLSDAIADPRGLGETLGRFGAAPRMLGRRRDA